MDDILPGYTRISEILNQWDRFSSIDQGVLKRKADIGTNVHKAINNDIHDVYSPLSEKEEGYFMSYMNWKNIYSPKYLSTEERFYDHDLKITGQIDGILEKDGKNYIIDFKTSYSASPKYWSLQGGFYNFLLNKNHRSIENRVIFLQLDRYGKIPKEYIYDITPEIIDLCMSCVKTYRYFNS